jgi:1-acyl-sn-glycerol-3-phosphate acyltransferase
MSQQSTVQAYIERQPSYGWRRASLRWLIRTVGFGLLVRVKVTGQENIPDSGPCILMMNHISGLDPILCMGGVTKRFVVPMSKIENLRNPLLGPFVRWWGAYTINRSEVDRTALINSIELLKSGQLILIAPEGTRQKDGLARPKDGLAYIATKANAVIVPAAISGAQGFTSKWKRLQRPRIHLHFGRPFRFKTEGRARIPREELTIMTEEAMYQLALAIDDEQLRGVYRNVDQVSTNHLEFIGQT